ncbi:hypothetical protein F4779DRAFT_579779 [Xylariaceae sp. FL0662B]|nr:hypothetical protein F4779DRAFT_579779 [Xylariaceae sp. FL0662B]
MDAPDVAFSPAYESYNDGPVIFRTAIAMAVLTTIVAVLRFWARKIKGHLLRVDDWLALAALLFLYGLTVVESLAVFDGGVGRHMDVILSTDVNIFNTSMLCLFIAEHVYGTLLALAKASILTMYYRIFPTGFMKKGCSILGAMVLSWWIAVIIVSFVQCRPMKKIWNPQMEGGTCLDTNSYFLGNSIPNIITDMLILSLPSYQVWNLQMRPAQKAAVGGIFLLGAFVIIVSCIRLKAVVDLAKAGADADYTVLIGQCWIWSDIESATAIICACLPTLQPLTRLLFGGVFGSVPTPRVQNFNTIVTIGGGSVKPSHPTQPSKVRGDDGTGSFERLHDSKAVEETLAGFWPKSYQNERNTTVSARETPSAKSDDIPLDTINVRRDIEWSEDRVE